MRSAVFVRIGFVLALALVSAAGARAQLRDWRAYPSLRQVVALDASDEALWVATRGGTYAFTPSSGEVARYTPVEGLHGVDPATLVYDARRDAVWVGYDDGVLDRLDVASGAVTTFFDIARADQYADRSVRRLRVHGDTLFAATAFGLVVFDAARGEVRDTYARLATLETATPVNDALAAPLPDGSGDGLWLATERGVVYAAFDSPNLQQPSAWTLDPGAPRPAGCLAHYAGAVHACAERGAEQRQPDGTWEEVLLTGAPAFDLVVDDGSLYAPARSRVIRLTTGVTGTTDYLVTGYQLLNAFAFGPDGAAWVGDEEGGLLRLPPLGDPINGDVTLAPAQVVIPEGPHNNAIRDIAVGSGGVLWASHDNVQNQTTGIALTAASRLDGEGDWTTFVQGDHDLPPDDLLSAAVAPDGTYYAASDGSGLAAITPDGDVVTYHTDNSTLLPTPGTNNDVYLGDAQPDAAGRVWVTNRGGSLPFHVRTPEGAWTGLPAPRGMPTTINLRRIAFDDFGQLWFTARQNSGDEGAGVVVVSTGADPLSPGDDQARHFGEVGTNGTHLPSEDVTALAFDLAGRLWIGTRRGLALIFEPGAALGGDPALATPQWARTADGASYLLRDLDVNDLAVDPAGQLWIGSTTGAWLLNAEGTAVLLQLTTENAPLFSDNVVAVDVDAATGRVYLATERGLLSVAGEATAPAAEARDLTVAPSPYRPAQHPRGVLISGLVAETTVYVLTPDGQRIAALDARGGSVRWDGLDERTGEPVASGVYLVAAVAADGAETAIGKVAVIR
jgi:sugar lactone lactonase YvrE